MEISKEFQREFEFQSSEAKIIYWDCTANINNANLFKLTKPVLGRKQLVEVFKI
tara:strand:+ start:122 stop:283 length:162 start_codon:yes stop_codon:yes gene_type:complete